MTLFILAFFAMLPYSLTSTILRFIYLEQVMEFNYLGVNITSSRNLVNEIKTQAQKVARVAGCLNDLVWRNKYMKKKERKKNTRQRTPD